MSAWEWSSETLCGGAGRDEGRPEGEMEEREDQGRVEKG